MRRCWNRFQLKSSVEKVDQKCIALLGRSESEARVASERARELHGADVRLCTMQLTIPGRLRVARPTKRNAQRPTSCPSKHAIR